MRRRCVIAALAPALTLVIALLPSCGAGPSTTPDRKLTARSLAAATIEHLGSPATLAAPIFPSQQQGAIAGGVTVTVRFASKQVYNGRLHVQVTVVRHPGGVPTCRPTTGDGDGLGEGLDHADVYAGCATGTRDGRRYRMVWQDEQPEEDPGIVVITARAGEALVIVGVNDPKVDGDPRKGRLADLTRRLVGVVTDPAVGLRTSEEYVEAGDRIGDKVWLDWYGQGNGSPKPKELGGPG